MRRGAVRPTCSLEAGGPRSSHLRVSRQRRARALRCAEPRPSGTSAESAASSPTGKSGPGAALRLGRPESRSLARALASACKGPPLRGSSSGWTAQRLKLRPRRCGADPADCPLGSLPDGSRAAGLGQSDPGRRRPCRPGPQIRKPRLPTTTDPSDPISISLPRAVSLPWGWRSRRGLLRWRRRWRRLRC